MQILRLRWSEAGGGFFVGAHVGLHAGFVGAAFD
jgi:hypothetical protein